MAGTRTTLACRECRQQVARWVGRCPGCGAWGTVEEVRTVRGSGSASIPALPIGHGADVADRRVVSGVGGFDRVVGGGLVPGSVVLLAGEPGIGKSTMLLHVLAGLSSAGRGCLLVSGEESHAQVASRSRRLGVAADAISFAPGRDLDAVVDTARAVGPSVLAVDSIQTVRQVGGSSLPGGPSQVRVCADALVHLAKSEGIAVLMTGHVTKDGDLAGPRTLEHAVDVVLAFEGDVRSGLRVLAGGKNRFGPEGEMAWFEMGPLGMREVDPTGFLVGGERMPGAAVALPQVGRRALAVEVQALVAAAHGAPRRQATGLDLRRFQLVAAVLDRMARPSLAAADLYGASSGGVRVDDPACDLAVAAALASAATGVPPPAGSAFVGEVALTGLVRPAPSMAQRIEAARAAGCTTVIAAAGSSPGADGVRVGQVRDLREALAWAPDLWKTGGQGRST